MTQFEPIAALYRVWPTQYWADTTWNPPALNECSDRTGHDQLRELLYPTEATYTLWYLETPAPENPKSSAGEKRRLCVCCFARGHKTTREGRWQLRCSIFSLLAAMVANKGERVRYSLHLPPFSNSLEFLSFSFRVWGFFFSICFWVIFRFCACRRRVYPFLICVFCSVESCLLWFVRPFHKSYHLFLASSGVLGHVCISKVIRGSFLFFFPWRFWFTRIIRLSMLVHCSKVCTGLGLCRLYVRATILGYKRYISVNSSWLC